MNGNDNNSSKKDTFCAVVNMNAVRRSDRNIAHLSENTLRTIAMLERKQTLVFSHRRTNKIRITEK